MFTVSVCSISGWLDDIGLPQYKDQFHEARVDGRMLQYLTVVRLHDRPIVDSLLTVLFCSVDAYIKRISQLHHSSPLSQ